MNPITINQKHYGTIEVDQSEKDVVFIIKGSGNSTRIIPIERENIPALIQSLLPENKEVKSAEEIFDNITKAYIDGDEHYHGDDVLRALREIENQFLLQPVQNKETLTAEEILDEEISESLKNILEQSDTPEDLRSFRRYILNAMERYKSQPALPTKEKEDREICLRVESKLVEIMQEMAEMDELRDDYKDQSEWHRFMNKLRIKQYLLEEILGIE